jgi:dTMP kinase
VSGRFVALEGIDGCGKSTQAAALADALRVRGRDVVLTREPGGTPLGEAIRGLLLDGVAMGPVAEAMLFAAARAQHVEQVIRPALARGAWVVTDRFVDSSLAYQGAARGLGIDEVWRINAPAVDGCLPDRSVVVEIDPASARARPTGPDDRIESEGIDLQHAAAQGYRELARRHPERVVLVDGDGSIDQVHARVMAVVEALA